MVWKVKRTLLKYTVYHPDHSKIVRITVKRGSYIIEDAMGKNIVFICENRPFNLTINGNAGDGSADIELEVTDSLVRPPRATQLTLHWNGAIYTINQTDRRDFQIYRSGLQLGNITGILKRTAFVELPDDETMKFAALLYALADRMLHEDDICVI
ncbi:hypothetical protein [Anaerocolumna sp. MB42-C2]|uniref:hypothetical protein n=1 Tax=Anaerocolumna sp. MB42-C2 TaxID=3070997 RepID=UPI0027DEB2BA|nr:hypothetical protein [Anaerocolumna sp. MB42-C2]WMJ90264.1 hypothetical protein RBU59_12255 [Anaerocolumna sp. MB42-C2]